MVDKNTLKIVNDALDAVKLMNREWQGLSDDEIAIIGRDIDYSCYPVSYARAIEKLIKEKNNA